jgi:hypothetical protein
MKSVILLAAFILLSFPSQAQAIKLEKGFILPRRVIKQAAQQSKSRSKPSIGLMATSPSQLAPYLKREIEGIEYLIAYRSRTREITFIHTIDKNFRTNKGLKVGDCVQYQEDQIHVSPGWYIWGPESDDGWVLILGFDLLDSGRAKNKGDC